ncbi:MAG: TIGR00730 family Rossman fold protein [Ignavibacteriaceae bacterium]
MKIEKVCVYCASSSQSDISYHNAARRLGEVLAENSVTLVYGAGGAGSMGHLADGALSKNGKVIGIIPKFMVDLEWAHKGLTEIQIVKSMHERKQLMIAGVDAAIALPGGSGTLEELMEAITWKRLGIFLKPIILVNTNGFFNPLDDLLNNCIQEKFMDKRHKDMWTLVDSAEDVLPAIKSSPIWTSDSQNFATI